MKIIVPKEKLQCQGINVDPNTFIPSPVIIIDEDYYKNIEKLYYIKNVYVDYSYFQKWLDESGAMPYYDFPEFKIEIGKFIDISNIDNDKVLTIIDNMYKFNDYVTPIAIDVEKKEITNTYRFDCYFLIEDDLPYEEILKTFEPLVNITQTDPITKKYKKDINIDEYMDGDYIKITRYVKATNADAAEEILKTYFKTGEDDDRIY